MKTSIKSKAVVKFRKRKLTKNTDPRMMNRQKSKIINCLGCHADFMGSADASAGICANCCQILAGPPVMPKVKSPNAPPTLTKSGKPRKKRAPNGSGKKIVSSGRPRGWHLKASYIDPATNIAYVYGKPASEGGGVHPKLKGKVKKVAVKVVKVKKASPKLGDSSQGCCSKEVGS